MKRPRHKGASRPSQNIYWDIVKARIDEEESSDEDEAAEPAGQPEPTAGETLSCQLLPAASARCCFPSAALGLPCHASTGIAVVLP